MKTGSRKKFSNIALIMLSVFFTIMSVFLTGCKLGEVDLTLPAYSCTTDGFQVNTTGVIITDVNGLALACTPQ